jgi:DNA-binding response OmpR family regulator
MSARQRILVVENDRDVRDVLCETLRGEGFPAEGVSDYESALALLSERGPYRLAVMDLVDAEQAAVIRKKHRTPVIVVSSRKTAGPSVRYVRKPYHLEELLNCVCETLSARVPRGG